MFKKKLNLSALATNKPIEQEKIKQIKNTNENNSLVNFKYAETIIEETKNKIIEDKGTTEEKSEEVINYNYSETILEPIISEKEEPILKDDISKIEDKNEIIEENETEIVENETKIENEKKKKSKKSKKVTYNYEDTIVELPTPESEEEREKRYEELASKIEINKEEFDYNREETSELFSNYQSDLEEEIEEVKVEEVKVEDAKIEDINIEKEELKKENVEKIEVSKNKEKNILKKEEIKIESENTSEIKETIKIKKKISKKTIFILSFILLLTLTISSLIYFINDIKNILKKEEVKTPIINTGSIDEQVSSSGIIDLEIDNEIKEEVEIYIEEIKQEENLSPEEIKKKINDKIIEIYLKKAMK